VSVPPGCSWSYFNTNAWIATLPFVGPGDGELQYTVAANPSTLTRTGVMFISGQAYVVTQLGATNGSGTNVPPGCIFALSPSNAVHAASSSTGFVEVATSSNCFWTAFTSSAWIHVASGSTNVGSGLVIYLVDANDSPFSRTGLIRIDGRNFSVLQAGNSNVPPECTFTLSPLGRNHGSGVSTGTVEVATSENCFWLARTTNFWITLLSPATNFGSGTVFYRLLGNAGPSRIGYIQIDGQTFTVTQAGSSNVPPTCTFALSPSNAVHSASSSTGFVEVATSSNCFWTAFTTNSWIHVVSGSTNVGSGLVIYVVDANEFSLARIGQIRIDGRIFFVQQAGTLSTNQPPDVRMVLPIDGSRFAAPVTLGFAADAQDFDGSIVSVEFFANGQSIGQGVRSNSGASWQTNLWYFSWSNVPPAEYDFSAKATDNRGATAFSAPVHVTVYSTNEPPVCTFVLSPPGRNHESGVSTGAVEVATSSNCFWLARTTNFWITLLSPATNFGSGTVLYRLAANSGAARTGYIQIDGQVFTVGQAGSSNVPPACSFVLSPSNATHSANSSTGLVEVATSSNCFWLAFTTNAWIHVVSGSTNVGSGLVIYLVDANDSPFSRTGLIRIDGRNFSVLQAGNSNVPPECTFVLSPLGRNHEAGILSTGTVEVTTSENCFWLARSTNFWIILLSPATNFGSGTVRYRVAPNSGPIRTGYIQIDGQTFTVTQAGSSNVPPACTFALSPSNAVHAASSSTGFVEVATSSNCFWIAFTTNSWIHVASGATNVGSGLVTYLVDANNSAFSRTGLIRIDGRNFFVLQEGAPSTNECIISISPTGRVHGAGSETAMIHVSVPPGCSWGFVNTNAWITTLPFVGPGDGELQYTVAANPSTSTRHGVISISGQPYFVTQLGTGEPGTNGPPACTLVLSPPGRDHGSGVSTGRVEVTTSSNCFWLVRTTNFWISLLSPATNFGSGAVLYRLAANSGPGRTGYIQIDGQAFRVGQAGSTNGPGTNVPPVTPGLVNLGTVLVSNIGHRFLSFPLPGYPPLPNSVVDLFVDQDHESNGGASLPSVSINWDTNSQFVLRVAAPPGRKFVVQVPEGRLARFGGFLWWESTRGGFSPSGTAAVTLEGLAGASPDFSDSTPTLSDSHGYFGFVDVTSSSFAGQLAFTAIRLVGTVTPQFTGNGTEHYIPHLNSTLSVAYTTSQTNDPGRFVSIVPIVSPSAIQVLPPPSPGGCATVSLNGPAGRTVVVECSEDLIHWIAISTNVAPCTVLDRTGTNCSRRFYRTLELPDP
jgi:hypothetical protein